MERSFFDRDVTEVPPELIGGRLLVDGVGDVVSLNGRDRERGPATLDPTWREFADGVFRAGDRLLVTLDAWLERNRVVTN